MTSFVLLQPTMMKVLPRMAAPRARKKIKTSQNHLPPKRRKKKRKRNEERTKNEKKMRKKTKRTRGKN